MPRLIKINVTNNTSESQNFFFFQEPADVVGAPRVYSNSLMCATVPSTSQGGGVYTLTLDVQHFACVQHAVYRLPIMGQFSGYGSAVKPIDPAPVAGARVNNFTSMVAGPTLGLTPPSFAGSVEAGMFRIAAPAFDAARAGYNAGSAMLVNGGGVILSGFAPVQPNQTLDFRPELLFYVGVGYCPTATVIDAFVASIDAALCDATQGQDIFDVTLNVDGSWTVTPGYSAAQSTPAQAAPVPGEPPVINAVIRNVAGTKLICEGRAVTTTIPVIIEDLSEPMSLLVHSEYQVSLNNGPFRGFILTDLSDTGQAYFD